MSDYPEHDKMMKVKDQAQIIGDFLDWLPTTRRYVLACFDGDCLDFVDDGVIGRLLDQYFDIDSDKVELEKRQMLVAIRSANADLGPGIVGG